MREQFEVLNAQLIEANKTIQERDRILSLMAAIDRQLSQKRRELSLSVTKLKYEKQDVTALEGLSLVALFYRLLGRKEEQLEKETAEYLELKMASEKCRLTVASLENQLQQFEAELVVLADCDDEYTLLKQQKLQLLMSLDNFDSKLLIELSNSLAAKQTQYRQFAEAFQAGHKALKAISKLVARPAEKAVLLADSLQPLLDNFQAALCAVSYQFTPPPQIGVPFTRVPLPFPETGIFLLDLLLYDPKPERKLDQWLRHLQRLDHKIQTKTDVVGARLAYINAEVVKKQEEVDRLVEQLWQPDTFTLFEG